jgi:hypothetical protein
MSRPDSRLGIHDGNGGMSRQGVISAALATLGLALALLAQLYLDRYHEGFWFDGAVLFAAAAFCWWLSLRGDPRPAPEITPSVAGPELDSRRRRALWLGVALVLVTAVLAPLAAHTGPGWLRSAAVWLAVLRYPDGPQSATNNFTYFGLVAWLVGLGLVVWALAEWGWVRVVWRRLWFDDAFHLRFSRITIAVLAIMLVGAYFRFHDLPTVPLEMTSDHTEKLLDISDILHGARPVYLPRNAGREPIEFYWMAMLVSLGMPLTFMTLKIGMAIASLLTIPVAYWVGREVVDREVGLLSALVMALAPWHLQITRIGLRIAFSPLFAAITLGFLYLALKTGRRNAWVGLGLSLGAGMYGYSGFRPMAFVVILAVALKFATDAWRQRSAPRVATPDLVPDEEGTGGRRLGWSGAWRARWSGPLTGHVVTAAGLSMLAAAPMIRFAVDRPQAFWGRTLTRVTDAEAALGNPAWRQLLINWKQALLMFNLTSDKAWFESPPGRPALETVGGALFVLGVVTAVYRLRHGGWREPLLLLAVPTMLVASVLALAFPDEVPHLSRAAGAMPAVVVLAALPLPLLFKRWRSVLGAGGSLLALVVLMALFVGMGRNTWQRYFVEYRDIYNQSSLPTSEGAAIARGFMDIGGDRKHVYLVGWPYGWDYRALGMQMGDMNWNGLLWGTAPDGSDAWKLAESHVGDPAPKLYFVGGDQANAVIAHLRELYPNATASLHRSTTTEKTFWTVFVPGRETAAQGD